jgi:hypothetical protein
VLEGRLNLRSATGWEEFAEGEVVARRRGERGVHGSRNDSDAPVRLLMISAMDGPNISVYPDSNQIGVFDAEWRFGALFNVADAVADYGGLGRAKDRAPRHRDRVRNEASWGGVRRLRQRQTTRNEGRRQHRQQTMEPLWSPVGATGGNRWQITKPQKRQKRAKTVAAGCDQLPKGAHGKEGVSVRVRKRLCKSAARRRFLVQIIVLRLERAVDMEPFMEL